MEALAAAAKASQGWLCPPVLGHAPSPVVQPFSVPWRGPRLQPWGCPLPFVHCHYVTSLPSPCWGRLQPAAGTQQQAQGSRACRQWEKQKSGGE